MEFAEENVVPLCHIEGIYLSFTTEQEKSTFVSLLSVVLSQTLSCCHSCGSCEICPEELEVDEYLSIVDMPENCNYEYYLDATCDCQDSTFDTVAKRIALENFINTTGQKLRGIVERKMGEGKDITIIATQKENILPSAPTKTIEATGLSSVLLSYEDEGTFNVALVCLECVSYLQFQDSVE